MKSVLMALVATTALSAFTSSAQAQSITFDQAPDVASPIEITVVSYAGSQREFSLRDSAGVLRILILSARSESDVVDNNPVIINNSAGRRIGTQVLTDLEKDHLFLIVSRASRSCPIKIQVNRETRKIERISPTCDELAELPPESQNG